MYKNNNKKFGFTLIELLVVVAIISLLSSIVFASLNGARDKARIAAGKTQFSNLTSVLYENAYVMWNFNEGAGTTVTDFGPAGKTGTIMGATDFSPGIKGTGIEFQGNDSSHVKSNTAISRSAGPWTMGAWVYAYEFNPNGPIFVSHGLPYLRIDSGNFYVSFYELVGAVELQRALQETGASRKLNTWYYVVATYTGSQFILYVDGKEVKQKNATSNSYSSGTDLYVGRHTGVNYSFEGIVDEVYYSGRSLLASEVQHLYAQGLEKHQNLAQK